MRPGPRQTVTLLACLMLAAGTAGCGSGGGDDDTGPGTPEPASGGSPAPPSGEVTEPAEPGPAESEDEIEAVRAARSYLKAIDGVRPAAVCDLMARKALRRAHLRGAQGPCEYDLSLRLGAPSPGGGPDWAGTRIEHLVSAVAAGDRARVTLEVFHRFSDRKNPSVEDDVIYLERADGDWLVSQPDATLYRAVGYPEPPLRAFTPPRS